MGKTLVQIRADIRSDLKDASTQWSTAELDRCLERAVEDLSRYLPLERTYELSLNFGVDNDAVTFPAAADADNIIDSADGLLTGIEDGDPLAVSDQPDVPRPLVMTLIDADESILTLSLIMSGTDKDGVAQQETLQYVKGQTSVTGQKYFKLVYSVEVDHISGDSTGDILNLGTTAYTDVWVNLTYHPVQLSSDTGVDDASHALARDTDYLIDYIEGKVKAISGGKIAAGEACAFDYNRVYHGIDISDLIDLIRVQRVEYPAGETPQSMASFDVFGKAIFITGVGEQSQATLNEGDHVRVYYDSRHTPPNDYALGTIPGFLEGTVIQLAEAYALLVYALKHEHQAEADFGLLRDTLEDADTAHSALSDSLGYIKTYLDDNGGADAAGILATIAHVTSALEAADAELALVDNDIVLADEISLTGQGDDAAGYLTTGAELINTITSGGENERTPEMYARYAEALAANTGSLYAQERQALLDNATRRTNAALAYVQSASQRIADVSTYIEQASAYSAIAAIFARQAEDILAEIQQYIAAASGYAESASGELVLSDRYRTEALERRNEVYSIWTDRKQLIGDFTMGSTQQMPNYKE